MWGKGGWFAIGYQWGYYLLFIALMEELVYRGWLPYLIQKSGLPEWCVWVITGILWLPVLLHAALDFTGVFAS